MPIRCATFAAHALPWCRCGHSIAGKASFKQAAHFLPRNRSSRGRDSGIAILCKLIEIRVPLVLLRLLRDRGEDESMGGGTGTSGGFGNANFEVFRQTDRRRGHVRLQSFHKQEATVAPSRYRKPSKVIYGSHAFPHLGRGEGRAPEEFGGCICPKGARFTQNALSHSVRMEVKKTSRASTTIERARLCRG